MAETRRVLQSHEIVIVIQTLVVLHYSVIVIIVLLLACLEGLEKLPSDV